MNVKYKVAKWWLITSFCNELLINGLFKHVQMTGQDHVLQNKTLEKNCHHSCYKMCRIYLLHRAIIATPLNS